MLIVIGCVALQSSMYSNWSTVFTVFLIVLFYLTTSSGVVEIYQYLISKMALPQDYRKLFKNRVMGWTNLTIH